MDKHHGPDVRVALEGFTAFEREQLATIVRGANQERLVFVVCEAMAGANLVVANADSETCVRALERVGRWPCTIALGTQPRPLAGVQLGRPLHAEALQRALHELVQRNPPMSEAVQRVRDELARFLLPRHARPDSEEPLPGRARDPYPSRSDTLPMPLAE